MHEGKGTSVEDSNCLKKCAYHCSDAKFIFLASGKIECPKCKDKDKDKGEFWPKGCVKKITGLPCIKGKPFYIECPTCLLKSCSLQDDLNKPHLSLEVTHKTFSNDEPTM